MAFEKLSEKKILATNLTSFIAAELQLMDNQRTARNQAEETKFLTAVLSDNLTLEDQLAYREEQWGAVPKSDKTERARLKKEIASIKDRIEQRDYTRAYVDELSSLNEGATNIDSTIVWLNNRLAGTTDPTIQQTIRENLATLKERKFNTAKAALDKQTSFAAADKTPQVLEDQIKLVSTERKKALLAGNDDYVATLDLQLQTLNKAKAESTIERAMLDFSVNTLAGQSASATLNQFNAKLDSAGTTPVTIGGVRYDSERQFWDGKRTEFLNDRSANGFFPRVKDEIAEKVDYKATRGVLTKESIGDITKIYDDLSARPELQPYQDRLTMDKQSALSSAATTKANEILGQFSIDLDARRAVRELSSIADTYGVNLDDAYQKVITKISTEKLDQFNSTLSLMNKLMEENPSLKREDALKQAINSGAGAAFSPEVLATKTTTELVTDSGKQGEAGAFTDQGSPMTVDPAKEGATFQNPELIEGGLYVDAKGTGYKYEGGKLRAFGGQWNDESFKKYNNGQGFAAMKKLDDKILSSLPKGEVIQASVVETGVPPAPTTPAQAPPAGTPPPPQATPASREYVVQKGDTLSAIAKRTLGDSKRYTEIAKINNLADPNKIQVGAKLKLP